MIFKTLYADPPWKFSNRATRSAAEKSYSVMSTQELRELGALIKEVTDTPSHIYLWSTMSHLEEALEIMKVWGFTFKMLIPWIKQTKHGKLHFGMGNYFRPCLELCLFGVKGSMRTLTRNTRNILFAVKPKMHSAKPPEMYELIEANSPPKYLELFSRNKRDGWTMLGDEFEGEDIRDAIIRIGALTNE